jgi:4-aminobutyrate aminotransferase
MEAAMNFELDRTEGDLNQSPARAAWQEQHLGAETRALLDEDAAYFLHQSLSTPCLNALGGCKDSTIVDLEGREYLDFHGNSVHQAGFGNRRVVQAIREQLDGLSFCPRRYTNLRAVELARRLTELAPEGLSRVLLTPGGTAAVGMALKLARAATGRFKTISWWDSFHGASLDAVSVGGEALFRNGMGPLLPGALHIPPPGARLTPDSPPLSPEESADYAEYVFDKERDIAAFVAEPLRCTTVHVPPDSYWQRIRALCDQYGALLIQDEIPLCLGRTGRMFACEHYSVEPDILVIGKGLGGGVWPLAAMLAREELNVAAAKSLGHYTHEKTPVGCAAALAALDVIEEDGLLERAQTAGDAFAHRLQDMERELARIGAVRHIGMLFAVELVDAEGKPDADAAERVLYGCLSRGLSFKVSSGNVLTLAPPLVVADAELDRAAAILHESICETGEGPVRD